MNKRKLFKVLGIVLFITILHSFGMGITTVEAKTTTDGQWEYSSSTVVDGAIALNEYLGNDADVIVPAELNGRKVVNITEEAFKGHTNLKSVTITGDIQKIADNAFEGCENFTIYGVPNSATHRFASRNGIRFKNANKPTVKYATVTLKTTAFTYDGKKKTPAVSVNYKGTPLKEGVDYTVAYSNNKRIGFGSVTVTGMGDYTGEKTKTFEIQPKKVSGFKQVAPYATSKASMTWTKLSDVSGYVVYRSTSKNGKYTLLKKVTTNKFTNAGLKAGSKYYYKVRAVKNVNGKNIYGAYSDVKEMITAPATPKISSIRTFDRMAKVSWSKVNGASGYEVYMGSKSNGAFVTLGEVKAPKSSFEQERLTWGEKYYFKVRAYVKTSSGKKIYSSYSQVKAVII
jgi:hypothetical protein